MRTIRLDISTNCRFSKARTSTWTPTACSADTVPSTGSLGESQGATSRFVMLISSALIKIHELSQGGRRSQKCLVSKMVDCLTSSNRECSPRTALFIVDGAHRFPEALRPVLLLISGRG